MPLDLNEFTPAAEIVAHLALGSKRLGLGLPVSTSVKDAVTVYELIMDLQRNKPEHRFSLLNEHQVQPFNRLVSDPQEVYSAVVLYNSQGEDLLGNRPIDHAIRLVKFLPIANPNDTQLIPADEYGIATVPYGGNRFDFDIAGNYYKASNGNLISVEKRIVIGSTLKAIIPIVSPV